MTARDALQTHQDTTGLRATEWWRTFTPRRPIAAASGHSSVSRGGGGRPRPRRPVAAASGMLDMLLGIDQTQTQKDYAQTAQMCGKALITLINDVLDRAKIKAGKLELEAVPFNLRALMDDVIS